MSNIATTRDEILDYWWDELRMIKIGIKRDEGLVTCWRCGENSSFSKLHRCHIIPHGVGGEDTPSNLVLLCPVCHGEAPSFVDEPWVMWHWIKRTGHISREAFICDTLFREYERIFGVEPNLENFIIDNYYRAIDKIYMHFATNTRPISFASRAYALFMAGA